MALTLYVGNKRLSSWSLRPYLALVHTGVPFECKTILLDQPDTKANIAKVSPTGRVPVLHHEDIVVWDSFSICEYVNESFLEAKLWPVERAQRAWARSISAEMHSGFMGLRSNMPMDLGANLAGQGHTPEALADAKRVMDIWRDALTTNGGPFLFGTFTIADAMFAPVCTRFVTSGVELDATCRAYVDAVYALPGMKQWIADAAKEPKNR